MGRAVLVFGLETKKNNLYWIIKFKIIDLNKIANTLKDESVELSNSDWHVGLSDLEIVEDAYETNEDDFDNLQDFLEENNLTAIYDIYGESNIGFIVDNYAEFIEEEHVKEKIMEFYIKYELNSPTIFAAICDEE